MSQPHNLHGLRRLDDGTSEWRCRCGNQGTAATADLAVAAHQAHVADATYLIRTLAESMDPTAIYATKEPTC
ncbi:MAG: hypothetical protein HOV66_07890 [Streptomycetaceae bacterium]|nr:hypothetical protein [Streptomycetaceae bacterium]NUS54770.1 hypothetical protein [Streptomycetaceae bacterium]